MLVKNTKQSRHIKVNHIQKNYRHTISMQWAFLKVKLKFKKHLFGLVKGLVLKGQKWHFEFLQSCYFLKGQWQLVFSFLFSPKGKSQMVDTERTSWRCKSDPPVVPLAALVRIPSLGDAAGETAQQVKTAPEDDNLDGRRMSTSWAAKDEQNWRGGQRNSKEQSHGSPFFIYPLRKHLNALICYSQTLFWCD